MEEVHFSDWAQWLERAELPDRQRQSWAITVRWYLSFCQRGRGGVNHQTAREFIAWAQQANKRVTPHVLRHSFASRSDVQGLQPGNLTIGAPVLTLALCRKNSPRQVGSRSYHPVRIDCGRLPGLARASSGECQSQTCMKPNVPLPQSLLAASATALLALAALWPARADYASTVMSLGPAGYWRLNEPASEAPNYALGTATNYGSLGASADGTYYHSSTLQEPGVLAVDPGVKLDGASQYIEVPYSPALNATGPFSVEFWANQTVVAAGAKSGVMSFDGNTGFLFYSDNNDYHWGFRVFYGTGRTYVKDTGPDNQPNTWYHVVGVYDGALVHIYVNGVENAAPQAIGGSGYVPNTTAPLRIGAGNPAGPASLFFPGWMDEVAVYPYALTSAQISAHYSAATANPAGYAALIAGDNPTAYWRFNEPLLPPEPEPVTVVVANQGSWGAPANGTFNAGGMSSGAAGVPHPGFGTGNTACEFTGTSESYIEIPPQDLVTDTWTVTCWAKRNGISEYWNMLYSNPADLGQPVAGASHPVTGLGFGNGGDPANTRNDLRMYWAGADGDTGPYGATPNPPLYMPDQEWTFLAMVASPDRLVLYMNDTVATYAPPIPYGPHYFGNVASFIGKKQKYNGWDSGGEVNGFRGTIDEVAVFDQALTADQILQIYGAAGIPPTITQQPQPAQCFPNGSASFSVSVGGSPPFSYQWFFNPAGTTTTNALPGATDSTWMIPNASAAHLGNYSVRVTTPHGSVESDSAPLTLVDQPHYGTAVLALDPVGYWRLNDAASVADNFGRWGTNANGTYLPGTTTLEPGVPHPGFGANNTGTRFAGTAGLNDGTTGNPDTPGSCIRIPAQMGIVSNMTITCWINRRTDQLYWRGLVTQRDSEYARQGEGFGTGITLGGNGAGPAQGAGAELRILWNKSDVWWQWDPGRVTPMGRWTFCAVVFSPTNRTVYLNTQSVSQAVPDPEVIAGFTISPEHDWSVNPIFIGYDPRAPYFGENGAFDGSMDEVAIFDRALTPEEMMQIYAAAEVPPIILVQPQGPPPPVYEGSRLSLAVVCDEDASVSPLAYRWTKDGVPMPGQTATNLAIDSLVVQDSGAYAAVISNAYGSVTSSIVTVTVRSGPPVIAQQPESVARVAGGSATFSVLAQGSAPMSYQWSFNGSPIGGATGSSYTVNEVGAVDVGDYSVRIGNAFGSVTSTAAALAVIPAGSSYAAEVVASGAASYWRFNETSGTTAIDWMGSQDGANAGGVVTGAAGPRPGDVYDAKGLESDNTAFTFNGSTAEVQLPPGFALNRSAFSIVAWIRTDPANSKPWQCIMAQGGNLWRFHLWSDGATLEMVTAGLGNDSVVGTAYLADGYWHQVVASYDGAAISLYYDGLLDVTEAASGLLGTNTDMVTIGSQGGARWVGDLDEVAVYDRGLTAAEVANLYRAAMHTPGAPEILVQPVSQMVFAGQPASFSVSVTGGAPYTYQWNHNGANIPGATKRTLMLPSAFYTDAGSYAVAINNGVGPAVSSQIVTLTVSVPPELTLFANVTNDLVLHLPFDDDYKDTSGRGNDGIPVGSPGLAPGKIGSHALSYGTDTSIPEYNYVTLGTPADLQFGAAVDFSVAFWVRFTGSPGDLPFLANNNFSYGGNGVTLAPSYNQGSWSWYLNDAAAGAWGGLGLYAPEQNTLNDGEWHHMVYTFDRTGYAAVYRDGMLDAEMSIASGSEWNLDTGMPFDIGQAGGGYGETGVFEMDDLGIWRRALSAVEAQTIYIVGQDYGRAFDAYGPVVLTVRPSGDGFDLIWQAGTLLECATVNGTYTPVSGTSPSYHHVTPSAAGKFYRIRL